MSTDVTVRGIRFVTAFPWLRLGRGWGCALAPQQMALACLAALVWAVVEPLMHLPNDSVAVAATTETATLTLDVPERGWSHLQKYAPPLADVFVPARSSLAMRDGWWRHCVAAAAAFVIWSIVGLAVCRCAAVQFCRDENPSLLDAVQFALARIANVCGAPLIPLLGATVLSAVVAVVALPAWIPALGTAWLVILAPILFVLSAAAAFVVLSIPVLWPLMAASVAVDDGDAFDAFSRAFSVVSSRFWSASGLLLVCTVEAVVAWWLLNLLANTGVAFAVWSADWLVSHNAADILLGQVRWWASVAVHGLMASLFWTLATIVYLFLREMVDGLPVSQLKGFDVAQAAHEPYPVVGLAATNAKPGA